MMEKGHQGGEGGVKERRGETEPIKKSAIKESRVDSQMRCCFGRIGVAGTGPPSPRYSLSSIVVYDSLSTLYLFEEYPIPVPMVI
jgi:hypothetical protein